MAFVRVINTLVQSLISNYLEVAIFLQMGDRLHTPSKLIELLLQNIRALPLPALLLRAALLLALDHEVLHAQLLQLLQGTSLSKLPPLLRALGSILSEDHDLPIGQIVVHKL